MAKRFRQSLYKSIAITTLIGLSAIVYFSRTVWQSILFRSPNATVENAASTGAHQHAHNEPSSIKSVVISERAQENLGLQTGKIELQDWWRTISIPAEVIEEPGHSEQGVSSTVHGIVLKIHAFPGQTVRAGDPLVDIQPTSELLATAESSLLKTLQEIELVRNQIERLAPTVESGAMSGMRKIEKEYELKRLESQRLVQVQELLVRGLTPDQIDEIVTSKTLIRRMTIRTPAGVLPGDESESVVRQTSDEANNGETETTPAALPENHEHGSVYTIESLNAHLGKLVQPGDELCRLARHSHLLIAGRAFERESHLVARALENHWTVKAVFETGDDSPVIRDNLSILYSDNVIDTDSNTHRFYIPLTNEILRDSRGANGLTYRAWRFKPGQRVKLMMPVSHSTKRIVLPAEAIVKEGGDAYVFRMNGKRFERVSVRVESLNSREAVVANDGTLAPGDVVARNQAFQLNLELKKSQGGEGGGHSHAGHSHEGHSH